MQFELSDGRRLGTDLTNNLDLGKPFGQPVLMVAKRARLDHSRHMALHHKVFQREKIIVFLGNSVLRDNCIDESCWSNVECWIPHLTAIRCNLDSLELSFAVLDWTSKACDLRIRPVLDDNLTARSCIQVYCCSRRSDDKLDTVVLCKNSKAVRSNLVGSIAISHDSIGTNDDG